MKPLPLASLFLLAGGIALSSRASAVPDVADTARLFADAQTLCTRDDGALWGRTLCGPIMVVDYKDRSVVANQQDAVHQLKQDGTTFRGTLPEEIIIADTPTEWLGTRWTQIDAPIPDEPERRHVLIMHELFHRIQPALGLSRPEPRNDHLDTLEGRYLLQLEWRALARGLQARSPAERRMAVEDAVAFRRERYRLFEGAAAKEAALEINEAVPEYTGVRLGLASPGERIAYALRDLTTFVAAPSFVRSFAYATGPAYGLLLDWADPQWRTKIGTSRFDILLATALKVSVTSAADIATRARRYDDGSLRAAEEVRERARLARLAELKARLVEGPLLALPLKHSNYQFNPQTLVPLGGLGTVYPSMRLTDDWGALEVEEGGALVDDHSHRATVTAMHIAPDRLSGPGWKLALNRGCSIQPGPRPGDFVVECGAP